MSKKNIICYICRDRVGYINLDEAEIPLRGSMIHRHPGCEHWALPLDMHTPLEFICPHADPSIGGDSHLFLPIVGGKHDEACELMGEDHKMFYVGNYVGKCPCGCGDLVREGNKYADNLKCYRRHVTQLKTEIEGDGNGEGKEDS